MSQDNSIQNDTSPENREDPGNNKWKFKFGRREKTTLSALVLLVAVALAVNSSIIYEGRTGGNSNPDKPAPTYTGSAPLSITSNQQALESNNDFILVITPCADQDLNASVTETVVAAADKIRSTDRIYVGVFTLPADQSLNYPTVFTRLMNRGDSFLYQVSLRSDITLDKIYDSYLSRKFLRE
ncbi:MAG: hypothetical protein JW954_00565 [Dehalococcoidaceae bacterium]|nr:hypothetical protein [Dehalococcoidaceae bacterium]